MNFRKKLKIFRKVLKNTSIHKFLIGYLFCFFIIAILIYFIEPSINSLGDSLWYCFVSCTTIGFGDITAVSIIGRILTVVLYIYTILSLALITALFTQFFIEISKSNNTEGFTSIIDKLENLENLSKEELKDLSNKIKKLKK